MGDQPKETKPAETAAPAAPAAESATAASTEFTAAPTAGAEPPITMDTPIEWPEGEKYTTATVGELINAKKRADQLGDVDMSQIKDVLGALQNDPEATKRILQGQLDALEKQGVPAGQASASPNEFVDALQTRITQLEKRAERSERVNNAVDLQEKLAYVRQALTNEQVAKALPWMAAKPEIAAPLAAQALLKLERDAAAVGQTVAGRHDLVMQQFMGIESLLKGIASPYGGTVAAPEQTPGMPQVEAVKSGQPTPGQGVVRPAETTPAQLLRERLAGVPVVPGQTTVVPGTVTEAGGVTGGTVTAVQNQQPQGKFTPQQLREMVKQQRARGEET